MSKEFEQNALDSESEPVRQWSPSEDVPEPDTTGFSRRSFLGVSPAALVTTAALAGLEAHAQSTENTRKAEKDNSASDPGPENKSLRDMNPSSNMPPPTDHGDVGPIWYSFDLVHKRIQKGG